MTLRHRMNSQTLPLLALKDAHRFNPIPVHRFHPLPVIHPCPVRTRRHFRKFLCHLLRMGPWRLLFHLLLLHQSATGCIQGELVVQEFPTVVSEEEKCKEALQACPVQPRTLEDELLGIAVLSWSKNRRFNIAPAPAQVKDQKLLEQQASAEHLRTLNRRTKVSPIATNLCTIRFVTLHSLCV